MGKLARRQCFGAVRPRGNLGRRRDRSRLRAGISVHDENASGGACGMAAFGAVFPSFEPGFVYTTPNAGGFELSVGVYDPANVANGQMNRTPYPRLEGEATFAIQDVVKLFASGFWQHLEGTPTDPNNPGKLMSTSPPPRGQPSRLHGDGRSCDGRRRCLRRPGLQPHHLRRREPRSFDDKFSSAQVSRRIWPRRGHIRIDPPQARRRRGASFIWTKRPTTRMRSPTPVRLGTRSCSSKTWGLRSASTRRPDPCTLLWSISEPSTPSTSTARRIRTTRPSSTSRNPRKR